MTTTDHINLMDLSEDGDVLPLPDGRWLHLEIETDMDFSINDEDTYGSVVWSDRNRDFHPSRSVRPDHMNGTARIIHRDGFSDLWWQPWEGASEEQINDAEGRVLDLWNYGYKIVTLKLMEKVVDSRCGEHVVCVESTSLGGCDFIDESGLQDILREMVDEVL